MSDTSSIRRCSPPSDRRCSQCAIRRRAFIASLAGGVLATPISAGAQQAEKVYRIGWLGDTFEGAATPLVETFRQGLRDAGYIDGRNVSIEFRRREGKPELLRERAAELVRLKVDAILAAGTDVAQAAHVTTKTTPIVFLLVSDPVETGLVATLGHPGGNVTGIANMFDEVAPKYVQLLKEVLPALSRVGLVRERMADDPLARKLAAAGKAVGVTIETREVRQPEDFDVVFSRMARERVGAAILIPSALLFRYKEMTAAQALRHRLPTFTVVEAPVKAGLLMSYQPDYGAMFRRAGTLVGRVLGGASPAEIPVEQPSRFQLVVNLKTARALGLTIPRSVLQRVDKVIE